MSKYDAIVIGAGHNGLTNAAYLAKAGLDVLVVEKNDYIGGAAVSREMHEGWIYSSCSYVCSMMRQAIHRVIFGDGDERLVAYHDEQAAYLELKRHSAHDADAMFRFHADLTRYSQLIRKTLMRTPPDPTSIRLRDIREFLWLAKKFWALGEKEVYEYIRFFTLSAAEFLDDYFDNDLIKAAMASPGVIGTALGVQSPGSAYILLHHVMGDVDGSIGAWGLARGGMGAISESIASALREFGGELRTNAGVQKVLVERRKAVGVVLENGDYAHHGQGRPAGRHLREGLQLQDSRLVRQGQYRPVGHAEIHAPAGEPLHQLRRPDVRGLARDDGARLRLLEARPLVGRSIR
jgi:phytoene dehydrogenase-like protein